jgi:hypothetical protein
VNAAKSAIAAQSSDFEHSYRIIVGPWPAVRADTNARTLEKGPGVSGVFAQPAVQGNSITVFNRSGDEACQLGQGSGLVAATKVGDQQPIWIVTGTDEAGLMAAARMLDEQTLVNKYAVATSSQQTIPLPVQ